MIKFSRKFELSLISISYGWLLLFIFLPLLVIISISVSEESYGRLPYSPLINFARESIIQYDFSNFKEFFTESIYLKSFFKSFFIAIATSLISLMIAYPVAYSIFLAPKKYKNLLLMFVIIPFWTSLLLRIYAWISLFNSHGIINSIFLYLGIISEPIKFLNNQFAVILAMSYSYLPFIIIPIYSSLEKIDHYIVQAAQDLGCRSYRIFWHIIWPLSLPGVITGVTLIFIIAMGEYVIPDLVGGINVITIGKILWNEFFVNRNWVISSVITLFMIISFLIPIIISYKASDRKNYYGK